jgi:hypothetical protein
MKSQRRALRLPLVLLAGLLGCIVPAVSKVTLSPSTYDVSGQYIQVSWSGISGVQESDLVALVTTPPTTFGSRWGVLAVSRLLALLERMHMILNTLSMYVSGLKAGVSYRVGCTAQNFVSVHMCTRGLQAVDCKLCRCQTPAYANRWTPTKAAPHW